MKNIFNARRLNIRTVLTALIVVTSPVFIGCSRQIAGVQEHQLKLQNVVQANAQQIATDAARIEAIIQAVNNIDHNQARLQEQIAAVQNDTQMMRENMIIILRQLKEDLSQISSQISSAAIVQK